MAATNITTKCHRHVATIKYTSAQIDTCLRQPTFSFPYLLPVDLDQHDAFADAPSVLDGVSTRPAALHPIYRNFYSTTTAEKSGSGPILRQ
jgi:hypothetical protein